MNKRELIDEIYLSGRTNLPRAKIEQVLDVAICTVLNRLIHRDTITLVGFGTFSVKTRAPREGMNPRTGETIKLPESKRVHFSTGKALKDALNR